MRQGELLSGAYATPMFTKPCTQGTSPGDGIPAPAQTQTKPGQYLLDTKLVAEKCTRIPRNKHSHRGKPRCGV